MPRIKVTFSNGEVVFFHEDQTFATWQKTELEDRASISKGEYFSLWSHHHDGIFPSFIEMLVNSIYFIDVENPSVLYSSYAVVKIELTD